MAKTGPLLFAVILAVCFVGRVNSEYLGKFLGKLSELHHGVSGEVYAVDGRTLYIKDYTYDGQGPAAYFYASTYKTADSRGFRLRDENNNGDVIRRYRKEGVTLTLPEGKTLNNIKIFYIWCEEFDVNFGDVKIPRNFDYPRPQKIDALKGVHSISSDNIVIVDAQTLLIPNLHYDGEAPDAKFWVGRGSKPSPQGIRVPDENGKELPLRRYDSKTVVLTLPGDLTVFDIGHFGIWCEQFTVDFGHIQIPQGLNVPPSLKMLGVSPQSKLNCEVLDDELAFEVRWAVAGESIVLQLVAKLENGEYMSFGLSGDPTRSVMIGGDVVVAWVEKDTLKGFAQDYYLADKSQCSGPTGSCPDSRFAEETNNIRLLNAAMVNGYSIVTYQRPLKASDQFDLPVFTNQSQAIIWAIGPLNQREEVSFHSKYLKKDRFIDFGRPAKWNCPLPEGETAVRQSVPIQNRQQEHVASEEVPPQPEEPVEPSTTVAPRREGGHRRRGGTRISTRQPVTNTEVAEEGQASKREPTRTKGTSNKVSQRGTQTVPPPTPVEKRDAWYIPPIECYEPEDGVFYAQMGPTGGKRGYPAITGHVGWGISWYINGLLIPEINLVRGKTYNFITEGGNDPDVSAKYHPFYITNDPVGGYAYKTPEEKKNITIFSGVRYDKNGEAYLIGTGRLCHWTHTGDSDADDFESFGAYQRTLQLKCDVGEPGIIEWTPDKNTPDTVYYQCFTHRYLGWKINVHDTCEQGAASQLQLSYIEAPKNLESFSDQSSVELEASPSVRQETLVMPNHILYEANKADNQSQPTVSEQRTKLDQSTPPMATNQQKLDHQIPPNTPFLFQSLAPQHSYIKGFPRPSPLSPHHTLGHYISYDTEASNFRASPPHDMTIRKFPVKHAFVVKKLTTTERPSAKLTPEILISSNVHQPVNPMNLSYIAVPLNFASKPIKNFQPKQQVFYVPVKHPQIKNQYPAVPVINKKPLYRQRPQSLVYDVRPELKLSPIIRAQQTFMNTLPMTVSIPIKTQLLSETTLQPSIVKNVEISPEQASTEREPEIQTASPLMSIRPSSSENVTYQTPDSNGFNPESIVVEGGFKPIINKETEDRIDEIKPEIDLEGEIGVIEIKGEKKFETSADLEPIFVVLSANKQQSKLKHKKLTRKSLMKKELVKIIAHPRSLIDSDIEPEMSAADRVESYYLPPPGQTDKPKIGPAKLPSAIDFEIPSTSGVDESVDTSADKLAASPPDIVVTFDGKRVSGASLTAKLFEKSVALERGSKATEYLKAHPQSVPFQGDLPPLNPNVLFNIKQQLSPSGVLSRDLDTPLPPPPSETTKLKRLRRSAHHTPEHTAQQLREMSQAQNNSTTSGSCTLRPFSFISLGLGMILFLICKC